MVHLVTKKRRKNGKKIVYQDDTIDSEKIYGIKVIHSNPGKLVFRTKLLNIAFI